VFLTSGEAVTGIFTRWRQLGIRYFWPHLLLGMVAASFGLPALSNNSGHSTPSETAASNAERRIAVRFDSLALLQQENSRRASFSVDYWHQHAIRTVIRHLSFALTPQTLPAAKASSSLQEQHLALLDTLSALLTQPRKLPLTSSLQTDAAPESGGHGYSVIHWLNQTQGIRAGPADLS
jgi:secretion monitor